jgi:hypothetical protein
MTIKRALLSVYRKDGIVELAKGLVSRGFLKQNRAGACQITTEGRNSAGTAGNRPRFMPRHSAAEDMALLVSFADGGF